MVKLGAAVSSGVGVGAAAADVGLSILGVVSPVPGMTVLAKTAYTARLAKSVDKAADGAGVTKVAKKLGSAGVDRTGKDFTSKAKRELDAENAAKYGGINKCEHCGIQVVPAQKSQRGVAPPSNQRERDHIIPKAKGGDGTFENGQILCRACNLIKRDK